MKFWQQFEINELYFCTKFRGNRSRNFGFKTRKPPRKFGVKAVSVKNGLSTAKNISYGMSVLWYYKTFVCLKIPFHPNQPTFGRDKVYFFFFFLFFFLIFVRSSFPKPQNIEI